MTPLLAQVVPGLLTLHRFYIVFPDSPSLTSSRKCRLPTIYETKSCKRHSRRFNSFWSVSGVHGRKTCIIVCRDQEIPVLHGGTPTSERADGMVIEDFLSVLRHTPHPLRPPSLPPFVPSPQPDGPELRAGGEQLAHPFSDVKGPGVSTRVIVPVIWMGNPTHSWEHFDGHPMYPVSLTISNNNSYSVSGTDPLD